MSVVIVDDFIGLSSDISITEMISEFEDEV